MCLSAASCEASVLCITATTYTESHSCPTVPHTHTQDIYRTAVGTRHARSSFRHLGNAQDRPHARRDLGPLRTIDSVVKMGVGALFARARACQASAAENESLLALNANASKRQHASRHHHPRHSPLRGSRHHRCDERQSRGLLRQPNTYCTYAIPLKAMP